MIHPTARRLCLPRGHWPLPVLVAGVVLTLAAESVDYGPESAGVVEVEAFILACRAEPPERDGHWPRVRVTPDVVEPAPGFHVRVEQTVGDFTIEVRVPWAYRDHIRAGVPVVLWGPVARCAGGRLTMSMSLPVG